MNCKNSPGNVHAHRPKQERQKETGREARWWAGRQAPSPRALEATNPRGAGLGITEPHLWREQDTQSLLAWPRNPDRSTTPQHMLQKPWGKGASELRPGQPEWEAMPAQAEKHESAGDRTCRSVGSRAPMISASARRDSPPGCQEKAWGDAGPLRFSSPLKLWFGGSHHCNLHETQFRCLQKSR